MTVLQFRDDPAPTVTWAAAGACWTGQLFMSWTTSGPLSASSQVDGFRLVRSGVVDSVAPTGAAYLLLVLPVAGLLVLGLGGVDGRRCAQARAVIAGVGVLVVALGVVGLARYDLTQLGAGGWVALAGSPLALAAVLLDRAAHRRRAPVPAPT